MSRTELINKILKKVIYRYKNYNISRCYSYISYAIIYYKLQYEEYKYIYKNFNKYMKHNPQKYDDEIKNFNCNIYINGELINI